ncbi:MAG: element excision factor XisH family protein [Saprospiraceae bacterium]
MRKDKYHDHVREALEKDGWTITHDPYFMWIGRRKGFIDLGAERTLLAAERGAEKIAVEIKSFTGASDLDQFEDALGQFLIYLVVLKEKEPDRSLILAVPLGFYERFFDDMVFRKIAEHYGVKMMVYDPDSKNIVEWIK